jgi:fatty-acyl-CoA synthase
VNPLLDPALMERIPVSERALPASTYALLNQAARSYGDRDAGIFLGSPGGAPQTVTYRELLRRVNAGANALTRLGVSRRDAVAFLGPNNGDSVVALMAAQAVGIAQPINPALTPAAIEAMLDVARTRVLVAAGPEISPTLWALAVRLGERLGLSAVLAVRADGERGQRPGLGDNAVPTAYLEDLAARQSGEELLAVAPEADDIAAYFHTGGTTGTPKVAAHTHRNEVFTAWCASGSLTDAEVTMLGGLPLFHVNGLIVTVLTPMFTGARVLWVGPLGFRDPSLYPMFWQLVEKYRVTTVMAVPTVYGRLSQVPVDADISSLTLPACGAAMLPAGIRDAFEEHTGVPICDGYGLTEAGAACARILPGHPRRGSVGLRMPYQHIRAVRPADGQPLRPGETGLIRISGPSVFPGYVTADGIDPLGRVVDGWLDTGDLGYVDADGYLFITGRLKDVIIRGGHNIDPAEIEEALLSHRDVIAASAVGRPDRHAGEVPVAYVAVRPGASVSEQTLVTWAADRVPEPAAAPKAVHILPELPVTAVGKDFKPALRADAVHRVVAEALPDAEVTVRVENGTPVAHVAVGETSAAEAREILGAYGFQWELRQREEK